MYLELLDARHVCRSRERTAQLVYKAKDDYYQGMLTALCVASIARVCAGKFCFVNTRRTKLTRFEVDG
jgi:hypothetical protein